MKLECDDIVVFETPGKIAKSRVSKVDGYVVKLFEEDGSYRQMSYKNLEDMVKQGFAHIEKPQL
jgi:hypothetical protein